VVCWQYLKVRSLGSKSIGPTYAWRLAITTTIDSSTEEEEEEDRKDFATVLFHLPIVAIAMGLPRDKQAT